MEAGISCRKLFISLICNFLYHVSVFARIDLLSSTTTYVQKGGKFVLLCKVPLSGVHMWYKNGWPIIPSAVNKYYLEQDPPTFSMQEVDHFITMRLIVEQADTIHTGEYKCNNFSPYSQHVVVVTENMIETNEDKPGMGKILVPGEELLLQCNTTECQECRVKWFKDGHLVNNAHGHFTIDEDANSILIHQASYNDSGTYVCAIDREQLDIALNATIIVQSEVKLTKFETSSDVVTQGQPLVLHCLARGSPEPQIKWFKGSEEISSSHTRIKLLEHNSIKNSKLLIETANYEDRDSYTCEAFNQVNSVNTTILIRIKGRLAALWPFLGICVEVAILCSIIFLHERRKSQFGEIDTDLPTNSQNPPGQKHVDRELRQRK